MFRHRALLKAIIPGYWPLRILAARRTSFKDFVPRAPQPNSPGTLQEVSLAYAIPTNTPFYGVHDSISAPPLGSGRPSLAKCASGRHFSRLSICTSVRRGDVILRALSRRFRLILALHKTLERRVFRAPHGPAPYHHNRPTSVVPR